MATPEEMLEEALNDTLDAIEDAAKVEIAGDNVDADVLESARQAWRVRYTKSFKQAIKDGHVWKDDKDKVLKRAEQVGRLATYIAVIIAILEELIRAGVGKKPGQDISLQDAAKPTIDGLVAECGALFIDCEQQSLKPSWDWCPRPSSDRLGESIKLLVARFEGTAGVAPLRAALNALKE